MKKQLFSLLIIIICLLILYYHFKSNTSLHNTSHDTLRADPVAAKDTGLIVLPNNSPPIKDTLPGQIATGNIQPEAIVNFAESLIGTPYKYASTDPVQGFDCSGFITYVFNHYQIKVPRSSYDFDNMGTTIPLAQSKKGDLILFTGTDSSEKKIGHMGIILSNDTGNVKFIHSSSGKAYGVIVSPVDKYYRGRFMKVVRVFRPL